jgi:Lrp/AsnC family transcriptional regulator, regulator for asnA, asnC and gidA
MRQIDPLDRIILQTLQQDGRIPFTQIAKQTGVSETTIRSRYQNLVEDGIIRTVGMVDPYALGLEAPALLNLHVDPDRIDVVAQKIATYPEVRYLIMTLGSFDLNVEVFCRDLAHLTELIKQRIHILEGVRSVETLMIAKSYKLTYHWSPSLDVDGS